MKRSSPSNADGHATWRSTNRVAGTCCRDGRSSRGLIVDYIGIGDELRDATATYARGGGQGDVAPRVSEAATPVFFEALAEVRRLLPEGHDYGDWRRLSKIAFDDRHSLVYGYLTEYDERRDHYLQAEHQLSRAFLLVRHLDDCRPHADEIIFYQRVRR